ncbi:MAG: hypothetical protein APF77_06570 [Clostridia bacterium BRH_c25]|nr:MAG: hypothetical protein APF77_06570 [Clostridia bacterium BRH_c25]
MVKNSEMKDFHKEVLRGEADGDEDYVLIFSKDAKLFDFGSGFGITADHYAKENHVTAIEPCSDMVEMRNRDYLYNQIVGDIKQLKKLPDNFFDLVICHNVLEYAQERIEILKELCRVLKPGGRMSIAKHNHVGRILQKVVFENNVDEAISTLDGNPLEVMN